MGAGVTGLRTAFVPPETHGPGVHVIVQPIKPRALKDRYRLGVWPIAILTGEPVPLQRRPSQGFVPLTVTSGNEGPEGGINGALRITVPETEIGSRRSRPLGRPRSASVGWLTRGAGPGQPDRRHTCAQHPVHAIAPFMTAPQNEATAEQRQMIAYWPRPRIRLQVDPCGLSMTSTPSASSS